MEKIIAMPRHEMWRFQYRKNRYLEHINIEDLEQRFADIFNNVTILTDECKISLHPFENGGREWMELFTHVLEEYVIRFGNYPAGIGESFKEKVKAPNPLSQIAIKASKLITKLKIDQNQNLYKYSRASCKMSGRHESASM